MAKRRVFRLRTLLVVRAFIGVSASVVVREAKRRWGYIQPDDVLVVEVLEALPGRPITGKRLVRFDGTIDLGYYGWPFVVGLTIPQAKERIVRQLRECLGDDRLGLVKAEPSTSGHANIRREISPADSDRVLVVLDEDLPAPVVTNQAVLDAINYAGSGPPTDPTNIRLVRPASR